MWKGREFQIHRAEKRKARDPNDRLCRGINSLCEEDERKDLVARPTERGGVAGASAPGPGGPKGALKKIKLV